MKKFYLLLLTMFLSVVVLQAQTKKKVGYFTLQKTMDASAATVQLDPVLRMLQADTNLIVTLMATKNNDTVDLTDFDAVVVQESYGGADPILMPGRTLALDTFMVPVVYNKTYAFRNGRALAGGSAGTGAETEGTASESYVYLKVASENQSSDLFKGITFVGDTVALFKTGSDDLGLTVGNTRFKAFNYARACVLVDPITGDTIDNTLLGKPAIVNPAHTDITISFNDIPAGTQIGVDTLGKGQVLKARMITLGMNFGAICGAYGSNITDAGLTIWRNAVYMAAGLAVPDEVAEFQKWKIGYFTLDKAMDATASSPLEDPIITMLSANNDQWDVEVVPVIANSKVDLGLDAYDAIIVQESISGGDTLLKPVGPLALEKLPVPTIYNKNYAFRPTRAFESTATGTGAETAGILKIKVDGDKQSNPLFKGITFAADSTVALLKAGAADNGGKSDSKALNYANLVRLTDTAGTMLALPAGLSSAVKANITVGTVSDIPAGDSIGSELLQARLIVLGMNFGALNRDRGTNLTSAGLTLWRNAVHSALGLPIPATAVPQTLPDVKVLLVANPNGRDDMQFKFLQNNSLLVEEMYPSRPLGLITDSASIADTLAMLNSYDLIIIGRSGGSLDFADSSKTVWNSLQVPIILNSQWIARSSRINWFNSGDAHLYSATTETVEGMALNVDDPIFAFSTFGVDNTTDWSYMPDDIIAVTTPINGDTVVYRTGAPLVVRFWEDSAFYPGSADTVRAPRTFFGFGADGNNYNFFPLTKSAQAAYYGEIMRITGNTVIEPLYYVSDAASILSITHDQTPSYMTPSPFDPAVLAYTILIPKDVTVDSVQFLATASPLATITGTGVVQLTSDSVVHRIYATAENKRIGSRYVFTIMKEKDVPPGFEDLTEAGITLFPNPANDNLIIKGLQENSSVRIMNTVGQLVYSSMIESSKAVINISSFDNGVYILQIEMNGKILTTKFIKQ